MQLKQLLNDDDAVSPVIGVILMVAITVILAAVIGTFVLGLGDQVQETSPNAQWTWEESAHEDAGTQLELTHKGGESVTPSNLAMTIESSAGPTDQAIDQHSNWNGLNDNSDIVAGASFDVISEDPADSSEQGLQTGDEVEVTWASDGGSSSATLTSHQVS